MWGAYALIMTSSNRFARYALAGATAMLAACATASRGEYTRRWAEPQELEAVTLPSGFTLRYFASGSGPPVVLLHTLRTQLDYFEKVVRRLTPHHRVYAVDLPGHGQSSILEAEYTEELFRTAVRELIARLDLRGVTLVGESIGGTLALTVASEQPERICRAIAINPYDYGESFGGGIRRSDSGWIIGLFTMFRSHTVEPKWALGRVMSGGFHDPSSLDGELLTEFHRTGLRSGYRGAEYSLYRNWRSWLDARKLYGRVQVPVTLVYSRDDWSTDVDRAATSYALPGAEVITVEGAGHFLSLERPDVVASVILAAASSD